MTNFDVTTFVNTLSKALENANGNINLTFNIYLGDDHNSGRHQCKCKSKGSVSGNDIPRRRHVHSARRSKSFEPVRRVRANSLVNKSRAKPTDKPLVNHSKEKPIDESLVNKRGGVSIRFDNSDTSNIPVRHPNSPITEVDPKNLSDSYAEINPKDVNKSTFQNLKEKFEKGAAELETTPEDDYLNAAKKQIETADADTVDAIKRALDKYFESTETHHSTPSATSARPSTYDNKTDSSQATDSLNTTTSAPTGKYSVYYRGKRVPNSETVFKILTEKYPCYVGYHRQFGY